MQSASCTLTTTSQARGDYAANCGDQGADELTGGPTTLAAGDKPTTWASTSQFTGVIFQRSTIRMTDIKNGTSNTFLAGEKYLNPNNYFTGADGGDNESMYVGMDNDVCRSTGYVPMQDRAGVGSTFAFGSAHPSGLNMLYCDGSASFVSYQISPAVFKRAGNRFLLP